MTASFSSAEFRGHVDDYDEANTTFSMEPIEHHSSYPSIGIHHGGSDDLNDTATSSCRDDCSNLLKATPNSDTDISIENLVELPRYCSCDSHDGGAVDTAWSSEEDSVAFDWEIQSDVAPCGSSTCKPFHEKKTKYTREHVGDSLNSVRADATAVPSAAKRRIVHVESHQRGRANAQDEHLRQRINLTDTDLVSLSVRDLVHVAATSGLPNSKIVDLKMYRRKLKNRHSARGSAQRRRLQFEAMVESNRRLRKECSELRACNDYLQGVIESLPVSAHVKVE
eukprot:m.276612 g.276612  ORF g.276612 m.276612 type:complete len:281 (-) comp19769_c0_seq1:183-1025(-)